MDKLRYVLFIPAALLVSIVCGVFGNWLGNFGIWILEGNEILGWILSGALSGVFFVNTGMQVAPNATKTIKWIVLSVLFFLGGLSALSFFVSDGLSFIAGIMMILVGLIYLKLQPNEMIF